MAWAVRRRWVTQVPARLLDQSLRRGPRLRRHLLLPPCRPRRRWTRRWVRSSPRSSRERRCTPGSRRTRRRGRSKRRSCSPTTACPAHPPALVFDAQLWIEHDQLLDTLEEVGAGRTAFAAGAGHAHRPVLQRHPGGLAGRHRWRPHRDMLTEERLAHVRPWPGRRRTAEPRPAAPWALRPRMTSSSSVRAASPSSTPTRARSTPPFADDE